MNLIEFLKEGNVRVATGECWLFWYAEEWVVMQHKYMAKKNTTLYRGSSLEEAVEALAGSS